MTDVEVAAVAVTDVGATEAVVAVTEVDDQSHTGVGRRDRNHVIRVLIAMDSLVINNNKS